MLSRRARAVVGQGSNSSLSGNQEFVSIWSVQLGYVIMDSNRYGNNSCSNIGIKICPTHDKHASPKSNVAGLAD